MMVLRIYHLLICHDDQLSSDVRWEVSRWKVMGRGVAWMCGAGSATGCAVANEHVAAPWVAGLQSLCGRRGAGLRSSEEWGRGAGGWRKGALAGWQQLGRGGEGRGGEGSGCGGGWAWPQDWRGMAPMVQVLGKPAWWGLWAEWVGCSQGVGWRCQGVRWGVGPAGA